MSKLIVEMEKVPKNCDDGCWGYLSGECQWSDHVDGYTMNGGRPRNCPICGVLPDEHGDLIDRDRLEYRVMAETNPFGKPTIEYESGIKVMQMIEDAFTVIPAERKDDGTTAD